MLFECVFGEWPILTKLWFLRGPNMTPTQYSVCPNHRLEGILLRFLNGEDGIIDILEIYEGAIITDLADRQLFLSRTVVGKLLEDLDKELDMADRSTTDGNVDLGDITERADVVDLGRPDLPWDTKVEE